MIWNNEYEAMQPDKLRAVQSARLSQLVALLYKNVPFYQEKMDAFGVRPSDIKDIKDIVKLPFTTKDDMREVYPLGLLAVAKEKIVEIHTSSGTTGKPVVDAYTHKDIEI